MTAEERPPRILLFELDPALRRALDVWLSGEGFAVTAFAAAGEAVELAGKYHPDAVVLNLAADEDMPVLTQVKERYGLPVLVMTRHADEGVRVRALALGADDVMLLPFDWDELTTRLRFLLGKPEKRVGAVLTLRFAGSKIEIDKHDRIVKRNGGNVALSRTEWALLQELSDPPGEPRFDGELLGKVFGPEFRADSAYLRLWIARLGEKLGDDPKKPRLIRRYHGAAYILAGDEAAEATAAS